jgi:hypothetical protein
MGKLCEPDDVEFFVGGAEPNTKASVETARLIEEYKKRPDYPIEAEEAERILAGLGIDIRDYGPQDAKMLLDHWHQCVADLISQEKGHSSPNTTGHECPSSFAVRVAAASRRYEPEAPARALAVALPKSTYPSLALRARKAFSPRRGGDGRGV